MPLRLRPFLDEEIARDLMVLMNYKQWRRFNEVIEVAQENLETLAEQVSHHIASTDKMVKRPQGGGSKQLDYKLSRLACYHVALSCDSRGNDSVKAAKHYFAVKTREAELAATPKKLKGESTGTQLRIEGQETRRRLTDAVRDYIERHKHELSANEQKFMYSNITNGIYLRTHKLKAHQLIQIHGCTKHDLRDYFSSKEIGMINTVEFIATEDIDRFDTHPMDAIKNAIAASFVANLFVLKYADDALKLKAAK